MDDGHIRAVTVEERVTNEWEENMTLHKLAYHPIIVS